MSRVPILSRLARFLTALKIMCLQASKQWKPGTTLWFQGRLQTRFQAWYEPSGFMPAYIPGFIPPAFAVSYLVSFPWFQAGFKPVSRPEPNPDSY
eukprot:7578640-Heterocapsa_arctica.AAC.1